MQRANGAISGLHRIWHIVKAFVIIIIGGKRFMNEDIAMNRLFESGNFDVVEAVQ